MNAEDSPGNSLAVPKFNVPVHACDCHMHVFDQDFPTAPYASLLPPPASLSQYRQFRDRLGLSRSILVQPSAYGTDNRAYLQLMSEIGTENCRMIAVVDLTVSDAELYRLHAAGVRGIRFNLAQAGATTMEMLAPLSRRVSELGWHCQIQMPGKQIVECQDLLYAVTGTLVFDHIGRIEQPAGIQSETYQVIRRLLDRGNTWVKLSAPYIDSREPAPDYADLAVTVSNLVMAAPERMLWGSDWPHVTQPLDSRPDGIALLNLLAHWVPDEMTRNRILVDNPARLYDFACQ